MCAQPVKMDEANIFAEDCCHAALRHAPPCWHFTNHSVEVLYYACGWNTTHWLLVLSAGGEYASLNCSFRSQLTQPTSKLPR